MKTQRNCPDLAATLRPHIVGPRHRLLKMTGFERLGWVCVFLMATAIAAPAQSFKVIRSFDYYGYGNGNGPQYVSLVQGSDGELYGTTLGNGWGTVFKITTAGELTVVCYFEESGCPGGAYPFAGLMQGADGNLYGTAWQGNASGSNEVYGWGTVFEITAGGQPITLYGFCSQTNCADGADPFAPLMQAKDDNFYGTTFDGGAAGYGTVYEITAAGTLTTLHSFSYTDGAGPVAGLIQAKNGNFYGTTLYGGTYGGGTVFEITDAGKLWTLHSFGSAGDGAQPYAGLVQAKDGNFYGTTFGGGAYDHGTVFEVTADGKLTTLYSFCSQTKCADGAFPYAGVIQATDGNFYGTTSQGGASNWGTVFAISPAGKLTTLHSFCSKTNCTDGADPVGGLIQAADGKFYGTTAEGGAHENGTVFSLSLGAGPQLETLPATSEETTPAPVTGKNPQPSTDLPSLRRQALLDPFAHAPGPTKSNLSCSPAPCVLPPTQASEGGGIVTDSSIVSNPLDAKQLLLGSFDANCSDGSVLGFHLSRDGGSTWKLVECMSAIIIKQHVFQAGFDPSVGYDRNGVAYIAGDYGDHGSQGLVAVQKSNDGTNWSKPVVALRDPGNTGPSDTWLTVDTSPGSPRVNSVYVSGIMGLGPGSGKEQVLVSHSSDGGATWTQAAVDAVQKYPANDRYTRMAVGKDGTVFVTWLHCPAAGPDEFCSDGTSYMMFSKSTDGGNMWSPPRLMAKAQYAPSPLPNTDPGVGVANFPVIGVDNSDGPHSGNLYVAMETWTGTHMRAQVIRSTDGGATWSEPVPVATPSATHDQFFPALSVSPTGKIGVSWLDRRNDPADLNYQAFAAISDDGGKSFKKNWQLTQAFSDPDTNGAYNWMGDYTGNTWAGADFIAAWMDSSNGVDMQEEVGGLRLK